MIVEKGIKTMNFYECLNSHDIANHLKNISYELNALECAWILFHCENITYSEMMNGLRDILNMPDCDIESENYPNGISLHQVIKDYFIYIDKVLKELTESDKNSIYTYFVKSFIDPDTYAHYNAYFKDYDSCMDSLKSREPNRRNKYMIYKMIYGTDENIIKAQFKDGELISIHKCTDSDPLIKAFGDPLFINLPTPFKPGDILYHMPSDSVIVLKELPEDMYAVGYTVNSQGEIIKCRVMFYTDLEYYTGELTGDYSALKAVSDFIKNSECEENEGIYIG